MQIQFDEPRPIQALSQDFDSEPYTPIYIDGQMTVLDYKPSGVMVEIYRDGPAVP